MEARRKIINSDLIKELSSLDCKILEDEPLYKHCSFKIGGPADFYVEIPSEQALLVFLNNVISRSYFVLGSGTNVLFSDEGYRGVIISLVGEFKKISILQEKIVSGGGVLLSKVLDVAVKNNLTGIECITGIPGTVGGAVCGNAGTKDQWICSVVSNVEVYRNSIKEVISKEKIVFGYRESGLQNCIITRVALHLKKDVKNDSLLDTLRGDMMRKRLETQPLNVPSAGSVFKNPDGFVVGRLVEDSGLKGTRIGGAQISELHGNFIVNTGGASSGDVLSLIEVIKDKIKERFGINLETELKLIN
ncbi:MAG: UDP-N-acetylmuramate dehydrogenase [Endomicrobium sp.]|jgi:UDP-N-acetylmuramate dehydrogenase|nr:UDP-N-acetylmuramate dehydrogenase [Endomicrobium sp.]